MKKCFKMLDISTVHLTENDAQILESKCPLVTAKYEEGFIVNTFTAFHSKEYFSVLSPEFHKIVAYAFKHQISFINFDRDGEIYEDFHQFNW